MAQKTTLISSGIPGQIYTFTAKEELTVPSIEGTVTGAVETGSIKGSRLTGTVYGAYSTGTVQTKR